MAGSYIYTSTDSGATWTEQTAAGARQWVGFASSSDGAKLAATVSSVGGGYIYTYGTVTTDTGKGYTHPPQCTAQFTPSTITLGEPTTLSWNIQWPTDKVSSYYTKVPSIGVYGSKTTEVTLTPDSTKTYQLATMNLYGATFCDAKITVLNTDGTEIVSTQNSYLTANSIKSPFGSMIVEFFKKLFGKK
jgi:hypothetical protein